MLLRSERYTPIESLLFDRYVVPFVTPLHDTAEAEIAPRLPASGKVLDVGCGGGQFAMRLAERFGGIEIVGLDYAPEQVTRARQRAAGHSRLSFIEGTAVDMPFDDASFDLVWSLGSLKHWPDPAQGLRECARVLAPGGALVVLEFDRGCRDADLRALVECWPLPRPLHAVVHTMLRAFGVSLSLDLEDARSTLAEVPRLDATVERTPGLPIWQLIGRARD